MKVGIVIAMAEELAPYLREYSLTKREFKGKDFYIGKAGDNDIAIVRSGVGKVNASLTTALLVEIFSPELVISTGTSGGLGRLKPFDMAIADKVCQYDADTSALGDPIGLIGNPLNKVYLESDSRATRLFAQALPLARVGTFACGDAFVSGKERAKFIVDSFDAIACDMESGAIGQVCTLLGVPFAAVRGISDGADEEAPVSFVTVVKEVSERLEKAVTKVLVSL